MVFSKTIGLYNKHSQFTQDRRSRLQYRGHPPVNIELPEREPRATVTLSANIGMLVRYGILPNPGSLVSALLTLLIFSLQLILVPDLQARPHAGFSGLAAAADSAGTAGTNPAGITRFESSASRIDLITIFSESTWQGQLGEAGPISSSDESSTTVVPSAYWVRPLSDHFSFGFTILGVGFSDDLGDWPGRYFITEYDSLSISAFPSLAYRVNDKLSVAGSLAVTDHPGPGALQAQDAVPRRHHACGAWRHWILLPV